MDDDLSDSSCDASVSPSPEMYVPAAFQATEGKGAGKEVKPATMVLTEGTPDREFGGGWKSEHHQLHFVTMGLDFENGKAVQERPAGQPKLPTQHKWFANVMLKKYGSLERVPTLGFINKTKEDREDEHSLIGALEWHANANQKKCNRPLWDHALEGGANYIIIDCRRLNAINKVTKVPTHPGDGNIGVKELRDNLEAVEKEVKVSSAAGTRTSARRHKIRLWFGSQIQEVLALSCIRLTSYTPSCRKPIWESRSECTNGT